MKFVGVIWGLSGVLWLLIGATLRLAGHVVESIEFEWLWYHWLIMAGNLSFMLYTEAYKGFQLRFSPRLAIRLRHLYQHPRLKHVLLAPLFVMGLVHATRRRLIASSILIVSIVIFIFIIRTFSQPLRGAVDVGVVVGLSYGTATVLYFVSRLAWGPRLEFDPEFPESAHTPESS